MLAKWGFRLWVGVLIAASIWAAYVVVVGFIVMAIHY